MSRLSRKPIFYVYVLLDPTKPGPFYYGHWKFSHEPFYVGKGKGKRANNHANGGHSSNPFKYNKIKKLLKCGFSPVTTIKRTGLTEKKAFKLENKLITTVGRRNLKLGPLTNLTDGGEGTAGYIRSQDSVNKCRETLANLPQAKKAEHSQKRKEAEAKKDKVLVSKAISKGIRGRTKEQKELTKQRRAETMRNRTPEQIAETSRKMSEAHARRSPEIEAARIANRLKTYSKKSKKEIKAIGEKISASQKKRLAHS